MQKEEVKETTAIPRDVVVAGGTSALGTYGLGFLSNQFIPIAMKTFGVVTKGVGTYHQAGGVAATLQQIAATCTSGSMVASVGVYGIGIYVTYKGVKYFFPSPTSKL